MTNDIATETVFRMAVGLGTGTNNEAEYMSAIFGLAMAQLLAVDQVSMHMDSELVVRHINGQYKVKAKNLKPYYKTVSW